MIRTIHESIAEVLKTSKQPLSCKAIYDEIVRRKLYTFHTLDPQHVVAAQLRRRCDNLHFASASRRKFFTAVPGGKYALLPKPINQPQSVLSFPRNSHSGSEGLPDVLAYLKELHQRHLTGVKSEIIRQLRGLLPSDFERFSRHLFACYGFTNLVVTRPSKDGGIDGHGRLQVGMAQLSAAFQCKKWRNSIGRPEVDRFRGAIQGRFEQGLIFTTSTFTAEAQRASLIAGAVPIVLFDGASIANIVVEKRLAIETEFLPVHTFTLDMLLDDPSSPSTLH